MFMAAAELLDECFFLDSAAAPAAVFAAGEGKAPVDDALDLLTNLLLVFEDTEE